MSNKLPAKKHCLPHLSFHPLKEISGDRHHSFDFLGFSTPQSFFCRS